MAIEIQLSQQGKHKGKYTAIVSENFRYLTELRWSALLCKNTTYAKRTVRINGKQVDFLLHRLIMAEMLGRELLDTEEVDHIDGNGLNCMCENLRLATHAENSLNGGIRVNNTTGFKGVTFSKKRGKYVAQITYNRKNFYLGGFDSPEEAHRVWREKAQELHKKFVNFG